METSLLTAIKSVILYRHEAKVLRKGEVELPAGEHLLLVDDLPDKINPDSLRVFSTGGCSILDFELRKTYLAEYQEEDIRVLKEKITTLEEQLQGVEDRKSLCNMGLDSLKSLLSESMASFARGIAYSRASLQGLSEMRAYIDTNQSNLLTEMHELDREDLSVSGYLDANKKALQDLLSARRKTRYQARVNVRVQDIATSEVGIEYYVGDARWSPAYDIRFDEHTLDVDYLANVVQVSGEDWNNVELSLSTTRPPMFERIPELEPWYVDLRRDEPHLMAREMRDEMASYKVATLSAPSPAGGAPEIEIQESLYATFYKMTYPVTVSSDRMPSKVTISSIRLTPEISRFALPSLTDEVYLKATAPNDSALTFLPGVATIYFQGNFMGKSNLPLTVPGEEISLLAGRDDHIRIERELVKRSVVKSRIGTLRKESFTYRIDLTNHRGEPGLVKIEDQIPVSQNADLKVDLVDTAPEPDNISDMKIMRWELTIPPGAKKEITYTFSIEYPKDREVSGI